MACFDCCFNELEGDNILEDSSSVENSCIDDTEALGHIPSVIPCETDAAANESNGCSNKRHESAVDHTLDAESLHSDSRGWTKSLKDLPSFSHAKLENKLVKNNRTMPDKIAPNAYRNMKKGYGLWKEGYVRNILVKANTVARTRFFLVKAKVSASMKTIQYLVYVHLNQESGDVEYAKCCCKAGQWGCCKHVAALLYTLLDFVNLNLHQIPQELTCTQVAQKWSVPSDSSKTLKKAVKFEELSFEKAEFNKTSKRPIVSGRRENYCATPPFAREVTKDEIKSMAEAFRKADRALLFCETVESNEFEPCKLFETSCSRLKGKNSEVSVPGSLSTITPEMMLVDQIFTNVPSALDTQLFTEEQLKLVKNSVLITVDEAKEICLSTMRQSQDPRWYVERSKRITASVFGKVINRRKSVHPTSLLKSITEKTMPNTSRMPASLKWGLDNEKNAPEKYLECLEKKENVEIKNIGLVVSPKWPFLGCSPDGIVLENGVPIGCIEIKWPYSKKDMMLADAAKGDKAFFLKLTDRGLELKRNHLYYYQCQGVVNLLGLSWIDFVVCTNVDAYVERILRHETTWEKKMLPELTSFFFSFILPSSQ